MDSLLTIRAPGRMATCTAVAESRGSADRIGDLPGRADQSTQCTSAGPICLACLTWRCTSFTATANSPAVLKAQLSGFGTTETCAPLALWPSALGCTLKIGSSPLWRPP